jgi:hypothetical protein
MSLFLFVALGLPLSGGQTATLGPGKSCALTYAFAPAATGITTATTVVDVGSQTFTLHFLGVGDNQLGIGRALRGG